VSGSLSKSSFTLSKLRLFELRLPKNSSSYTRSGGEEGKIQNLAFENRLKKDLSSVADGGVARETRYATEDTS
jgi:hypothetical protein